MHPTLLYESKNSTVYSTTSSIIKVLPSPRRARHEKAVLDYILTTQPLVTPYIVESPVLVNDTQLVFPRWPTDAISLAEAQAAAPTPVTAWERRVAAIVRDVARALCLIHGLGLAHCDVKPDNILVGPDRAVLCDFANTAWFSSTVHPGGTIAFMAPELADGVVRPDSDLRASDVFSLGSTACTMLLCMFDSDDEDLKTAGVSDDARSFVRACCAAEPARRITAEMALAHPWLAC